MENKFISNFSPEKNISPVVNFMKYFESNDNIILTKKLIKEISVSKRKSEAHLPVLPKRVRIYDY